MVEKWFSFFLPVKIGKIFLGFILKTSAVLVLEASERPASRAVNRSTGAEMVRAGRSF